MGMFDTVRSSYDLGPGFYMRDLQTKDLECLMCEYWIDPIGQLFEIDYTGTQDFLELGEDHPEYDHERQYLNVRWVCNGRRGKVRPLNICKMVEMYPAKWDCKYAAYPSIFVSFWNGKVRMVEPNNERV